MITSITPIPNRYPKNLLLISGRNSPNYRVVATTARLFFYKVTSIHGQCGYEHVFASDCHLDPIGLRESKMWSDGPTDHSHGGTLVPISLTRTDRSGRQTFLFPHCISFLFNSFIPGVPLDEADILSNRPRYYRLSPNCDGVVGISEFNFARLNHPMRNQGWLGMSINDRQFMSLLTPELPEKISSYVEEILYLRLMGDNLAKYITDVAQYENQQMYTLKDYLEQFRYSYPLDPITLECLSTPSYLYGYQLRSYLSDPLTLQNNETLGYHPCEYHYQSLMRYQYGVDSEYPVKLLLEEYGLIEAIINAPSPTYWVDINEASYVVNAPTFGVALAPSVYEPLVKEIRRLFKCPRVCISRAFNEEVFIYPFMDNAHCDTVYYINLAWYHLISPSLINSTLVNS